MKNKFLCLIVLMGLCLPQAHAKSVKKAQTGDINSVVALSERLEKENDPNYGDMYIQHKPKFKIIVLFADNRDRSAWLKSLSPKLRRHVQIKQAKKSRSQFLREQDELAQALQQAGIQKYVLRYDLEEQQFLLDVGNQTDRETAEGVSRELRYDDVLVRVGNLPVPERMMR